MFFSLTLCLQAKTVHVKHIYPHGVIIKYIVCVDTSQIKGSWGLRHPFNLVTPTSHVSHITMATMG